MLTSARQRLKQYRRRMHELAATTVITRSNITRLADRLEAFGLIERDRNCEDRRGAYAVLTPEGARRRQEIWQIYGKAIETFFERHVTGTEAKAMEEAIHRILKNLQG
jgi:DNA-binding MarR family transcriptional regulator